MNRGSDAVQTIQLPPILRCPLSTTPLKLQGIDRARETEKAIERQRVLLHYLHPSYTSSSLENDDYSIFMRPRSKIKEDCIKQRNRGASELAKGGDSKILLLFSESARDIGVSKIDLAEVKLLFGARNKLLHKS